MTRDHADARRQLLDTIVAETRETEPYTGRHELKPSTLEAIMAVDRAQFIDPPQAHCAYADRPLGIGHGQTISQPFIVALMTDLLDIDAHSRVFEVGTGSGYQAAVLGEIAERVDSVEIVPELADEARRRLARLGYRNVHVSHGNGRRGDPAHAPFDAIIVTAAAPMVPDALVKQLAPGGRLVIPVDVGPHAQSLKLIEKDEQGEIVETDVLPVMFVPLTGRTDH